MRIFVFGDSIARGSFDAEYGGWANRLSAAFNEKTLIGDEYFNTFNLGIGGETSVQLQKRITNEVGARSITSGQTVSLLLSGANDSKFFVEENKNQTDLDDFKVAYTQVVQELKKVSDYVFCLGLTRMDESKTNPIAPNNKIAFRNKELERYEMKIQEVVKDEQVKFIKIDDAFGVQNLAPDGIHPNTEGHRLIFERVKEALEQANIL